MHAVAVHNGLSGAVYGRRSRPVEAAGEEVDGTAPVQFDTDNNRQSTAVSAGVSVIGRLGS